MWDNFFAAGGWGMYPTLIFGFVLLVASALALFRRDARQERVAQVMSGATFYSGVLGTCTGMSNSVHYVKDLPASEQFLTLAMGFEESLHVVILSLLFVVLAGLIRAAVAYRLGGERR